MKFMVCYDETDVSKDVVREAQKHAKAWQARIEVVSTVMRVEPIKRSKLEEMEEQFESEVQDLFEGVDIPYNVQLQIDDIDVGAKIVKLAEKKKVDLIFIGIKKRSKVGKLLFGSNAQYIILNAQCPVVSVNRSSNR
jgi:nucleotide-binding universal stress UspA family protein